MKKILAVVALTMMTMLGGAPAALASPPTDVVVEDTAGVLYQPQLLPAVKAISFRQPTKVAVVTIAGVAGTNVLNAAVLELARDKHPEWLSSDGQKWADGLFILAVDPIARKVGTFMGEDRKVSPEDQDKIQESTKSLFAQAQWTDGTIAGVKKGAALINRPWYLSPGFIVTTCIAVGAAVLGFGAWLVLRKRNRVKAQALMKTGDASFANVSLDLEVTELNAKTIPQQSTYGAQVLEKYRNFSTSYAQVTALNQQSHAFSQRDISQGKNVKVVQAYADAAVELDGLDDVIADTNTLLNKFSGWEAAWDRQVRPLRDDLDKLPELLNRSEARGLESAAALGSFSVQTQDYLQLWASQIHNGTLTPESALDRLKETRAELGQLLSGHSDAMIGQYAKTTSEADRMRRTVCEQRNYSTGHGRPNILGTVYGMNVFYTVSTFDHAYSSARSSVDSARSSSSSGGSSTGYGSSGGSFSGSGSSSSF
ncbi:DUF5129 domain-containing protein [Arthrobacter sp. GMC3]|uniref:DUF5129 domain-containing protein n=1 Tax=Arthrobacter sp. GMC3 TaxID=2058894 RepID=UPI000CE55511|nr:DUF5129 domain-containing protein [Arthrobacter sp. GMC3]